MHSGMKEQGRVFSRLRQQRGASMVEFAIVAPLLFILLFGIIEFGIILYDQAVITNASREGARYAAMYYIDPTTGSATRDNCTDVQNYVVNYVNARLITFTSGNTFGTNNVKCPSGTPYSDPGGGGATDYAGYVDTVNIQYPYNFLVFGNLAGWTKTSTNCAGSAGSYSFCLSATTVMRDENQN